MSRVPRIRPALLLAALLSSGGWVTGCQNGLGAVNPARVVVKAPPPVELQAGSWSDALLEVTVAEGFHVQAHTVPFSYLIPTRLEMGDADNLEVGDASYPAGNPYQLTGSQNTLSVYDGTFFLNVPLRAPAVAPPGLRTVRGTLRYQLCDDRMCFRPSSVAFELTLRVRTNPGRSEHSPGGRA